MEPAKGKWVVRQPPGDSQPAVCPSGSRQPESEVAPFQTGQRVQLSPCVWFEVDGRWGFRQRVWVVSVPKGGGKPSVIGLLVLSMSVQWPLLPKVTWG